MATTDIDPTTLPPIVELSPEEAWADFDATARLRLNVTGEEFLRGLDAGEYEPIIDDPMNHPWVGYLAQLSRYVR